MAQKIDDEKNSPEPFYHQSENYVSAYFGNIPEHLQQLSGKTNEKQLMATLISLLTDERNRELKDDTLALLRNNNASGLLVAMLEKKEYEKHRRQLLAACWESGLDFSPYLNAFVQLAIDSDYGNSLEAMTIIQENMNNIAPSSSGEAVSLLEAAIQNENPNRQLLEEILEKLR